MTERNVTDDQEFAELDQSSQETAKQNTFQKRLFRTIKSTTGQCKMVVIPRLVLEFCNNDICNATMLSHLIYLCDKGHMQDGFIYKSYREWKRETGLSQYEVTKASRWLRDSCLITMDKKRIYGHPTIHYRLNQELLVKSLSAILCKDIEDGSTKLAKRTRLKFLQSLLKN